MPGLRERNKRMKLQRIIAEARQLFVRQGFTETTIQEIAEAADVGLGTLYLYAKSKEDLLVLVFRENLLQMIETSFDSIPERLPFIEQVMAFFDGHIEYHKENSILARTVLKELSFPVTPQRHDDIRAIVSQTYRKLAALVRRAAQDHSSRPTLLSPPPYPASLPSTITICRAISASSSPRMSSRRTCEKPCACCSPKPPDAGFRLTFSC